MIKITNYLNIQSNIEKVGTIPESFDFLKNPLFQNANTVIVSVSIAVICYCCYSFFSRNSGPCATEVDPVVKNDAYTYYEKKVEKFQVKENCSSSTAAESVAAELTKSEQKILENRIFNSEELKISQDKYENISSHIKTLMDNLFDFF